MIERYIGSIKQEPEYNRRVYEEWFFVAVDTKDATETERTLILDHLFSRLQHSPTAALWMYEGIGAYLTCANMIRFTNPLLTQVLWGDKQPWWPLAHALAQELHRHVPKEVATVLRGQLVAEMVDLHHPVPERVQERYPSIFNDPDDIPF